MVIPIFQNIGEPVPFEQLIEVKGTFDRRRDRELFHRHITSIRKKLQPLGLLAFCSFCVSPDGGFCV